MAKYLMHTHDQQLCVRCYVMCVTRRTESIARRGVATKMLRNHSAFILSLVSQHGAVDDIANGLSRWISSPFTTAKTVRLAAGRSFSASSGSRENNSKFHHAAPSV